MLSHRAFPGTRAVAGNTIDPVEAPWGLLSAPPPAPASAVRRSELVARLTGACETALTLIVAPAGYGKTTLLCEWAERDEREFLWVAFAEREIDIPRLAARRGWEQLPELIETIRRRHASFVLVVDDAHWIDRASLSTVLQAALNELPPGSTIALAGRTEPPLPTGRLLAHHVLSEVRTPHLAMTVADAAELVAAEGVELEAPELEALVTRTAGWPAALYLTALSLREESGDPGRLVQSFVRDEIIDPLPPGLRDFAVRASILEELSASACDAVLETEGSGRRLDTLSRLTALLEPIDGGASAFRWHPLVREVLLAALAVEPDEERRLRRRACAWYRDRGDAERAIEQAAGAKDAAVTGNLLAGQVVRYLMSGRGAKVRAWLEAFSAEDVRTCAPLALSASLTALTAGELSEAERLLAAASAALEHEEPTCEHESIALGVAVVQGMTARHGVAGMSELGTLGQPAGMRGGDWWPLCLFLTGVSVHLTGDRDAAEELLEESSRRSRDAAPCLAAMALAQHAMIAMERRDWQTASESTERSMLVVEEWGLAREPLSALAYAAAAASRAHQGRVDEAKNDLRHGIDLLTALRDFLPWYEAEARMLLAHASLWLADVVGARTLLAEASRFARKAPDAVAFRQWFDDAWAYMDDIAESRLTGPSSLTIAELRILRFLPSHRSFREIASQLGVSANTVKTQAHAVYRKLGAASRSEAVQRAAEAGLLGQ